MRGFLILYYAMCAIIGYIAAPAYIGYHVGLKMIEAYSNEQYWIVGLDLLAILFFIVTIFAVIKPLIATFCIAFLFGNQKGEKQ